jgi:subtilisin family serine protease
LLQLEGPTTEPVVESIARCGVELFQYIHPFTYVVWGTSHAAECASLVDGVRWTGAFQPADAVLPRWRALGSGAVHTRVVSYDSGARGSEIRRHLEAFGASIRGSSLLSDTWRETLADVPGSAWAHIARHPAVYTVQPVPQDGGTRTEIGCQVAAGNIDGDGLAFVGYGSWLASRGLDGDGVIIANVDSGIDQDHPDLVARMLGCTGPTCGNAALSSHGTHTAGIMAGDATSGATDTDGFLRGLGVAPGASLVEQVYSPTYTEPGGMLALMTGSVRNAAVVSGNSWGPAGTPRGYDADTRQVDVGTRDADPDAPGHQQLLYVLSIIYGYGGVSSQGTPDEAKSIVTVGSTKLQLSSDQQAGEPDNLSANSAHGPALDGRTIPHLVAPGCWVDSSVPGDSWGLKCGTSMASPHVSGAAALYIQQRRLAGRPDPSPALIKAALLASADSLDGHLDADGEVMGHPFDSKQGWGRVNLSSLLDPGVATFAEDQSVLLDATGDSFSEIVTVDDPGRPVRLMLAWTDAPGHGLGGTTPAWCNDLNLEVVVDGAPEFFPGNSFDADGWSVPGGLPDQMNTTEGVLLPAGTEGPLLVRVTAANLTSDGVPGTGDGTDQDFALVAQNLTPCTATPAFSGIEDVGGSDDGSPAALKLTWSIGAPGCGGTLAYKVYSDRGSGSVSWDEPLLVTEELAAVVYGVAPSTPVCFGVRASELGRSELNTITLCGATRGTPIAGDANCNGTVSTTDLERAVAVLYGADDCGIGLLAADADRSGDVDAADLTWHLGAAGES